MTPGDLFRLWYALAASFVLLIVALMVVSENPQIFLNPRWESPLLRLWLTLCAYSLLALAFSTPEAIPFPESRGEPERTQGVARIRASSAGLRNCGDHLERVAEVGRAALGCPAEGGRTHMYSVRRLQVVSRCAWPK